MALVVLWGTIWDDGDLCLMDQCLIPSQKFATALTDTV